MRSRTHDTPLEMRYLQVTVWELDRKIQLFQIGACGTTCQLSEAPERN